MDVVVVVVSFRTVAGAVVHPKHVIGHAARTAADVGHSDAERTHKRLESGRQLWVVEVGRAVLERVTVGVVDVPVVLVAVVVVVVAVVVVAVVVVVVELVVQNPHLYGQYCDVSSALSSRH